MNHKVGSSVLGAANVIMITMLVSRILGFLRDIIIYVQFGQNRVTDAYNAAFSIPDFLYMLLVGGALSSAFIPIFSAYIARKEEKEGWEVVSIVFNWIMILLAIGLVIGIAFAPQLVNILVPGFEPEYLHMTVVLTRIMFIQVIFMVFSGISTGILNSYKIFTPSAVGGMLYNLGIIVGGLVLAAPIEAKYPGFGIAGFSIGVVFGAMLNFCVQIPALIKVGVKHYWKFDLKHPGVQKLIALMVPVFIGLAVSEINLFVNQNLASGLDGGIVAALRSAQRLMQLPISLFGISIAMAFFPTMTGFAAKGELDEYKTSMMTGLRAVLFITIPASFGIAVLREPIIQFMYEFSGGAFTHADTIATGEALLFYSIGICSYAAIHVLSRAFYSLEDTKTPVIIACTSLVVNIILSLVLVKPMEQGGLALAYSIAGVYNMVALIWLLDKKVHGIGQLELWKRMGQTIAFSIVMAAAVSICLSFTGAIFPDPGKIGQFVQLMFLIAVGAVTFGSLAIVFKMPEADTVLSVLGRKFGRKFKKA